MSAYTHIRMSRRAVLIGSLLGAGSVALPLAAAAEPATATDWTGTTSANGWPVLSEAVPTAIEGSGGVTVALAAGLPNLVLGHFLRRYLYEVAGTFRKGDVVGHRTSRAVAAAFESDHLSGTAVEVFGARYPLRAADGMFPAERRSVEAILGDFGGVIAWGGHLDPVKQSHFAIAVPPGDARLQTVADGLMGIGMTATSSFTVGMGRQTT